MEKKDQRKKKVYPCGDCGKPFCDFEKMIDHQFVEHKEVKFFCNLPGCDGDIYFGKDNAVFHKSLHKWSETGM